MVLNSSLLMRDCQIYENYGVKEKKKKKKDLQSSII
jgi:hypothetical protein